MTSSPLPQHETTDGDAPAHDRIGSRVDAWLAAAREREAARQAAMGARSPARAALPVSADPAGSPNDAGEVPASAPGSMSDWMNRAEQRLAERAPAAIAPQTRSEGIQDAVGDVAGRPETIERPAETQSDPVGQAPSTVRRLEERLFGSPSPAATDFESAMRSFEDRLGELSRHVSASPKPIGRRGLTPEIELKGAVAEIRSRQAELDVHPRMGRDLASLPAMGTMARSQTAILTTLKADVARLSTRIEEAAAAPARADDTVQAEAATRRDLDRLEAGIKALTLDLSEMRAEIQGVPTHAGFESLQAEIRRLADRQTQHDPHPIARDIEALSQKLDLVAKNRSDSTAVEALGREIADVRDMLTQAAAPQALSIVDANLEELRRDIAEVGGRQVDAEDFSALKAVVEDIRSALSEQDARVPAREVAQIAREVGQPIETILSALVDKIDRVERQVSDPEALDHLEQRIQDLSARISSQTPDRDLGLSGLETSITALMSQVEAWRNDSIDVAAHAARSAVAEAVGSMPSPQDLERHLGAIHDHYAAAEDRLNQSLSGVHGTLDHVMQRLCALETTPAAAPSVPAPQAMPVVEPSGRAAEPQLAARAAPAPMPGTSSPLFPEGEILLEPGAGRPTATVPRMAPSAPAPDHDVKSSFIAAARRAAQAAQAETATTRKADRIEPVAKSSTASDIVRRIHRMIDERRRPLLLSAAALVLALGTMQIVSRSGWLETPTAAPRPVVLAMPRPAAPVAPAASLAPAAPTAAPVQAPAPAKLAEVPDPTTTQSIGSRIVPSKLVDAATEVRDEATRTIAGATTAPASVPDKDAARVGEPAAATAAAVSPIATLPMAARAALPVDPAAVIPPGLKTAVAAGNPLALYELGVRTADGRGTPRDPKAALALFEKAAAKGVVPAQYWVGNAYERGVGAPRDVEAAKTWYKKAADGGNVRAMHNLAVLLAEAGAGGKPDYATAIGWFTKAAEHGVRDSQFNLAVLYARGLGVPQSLAKSYLWLAIAAGQGDEDAGRKRDEVAGRLPAPDLAKVKAEVEKWRAAVADVGANEVPTPSGGWTEPSIKRASR